MKRRKEMEKNSEIKEVIEEVSLMIRLKSNAEAHYIPTKPFLSICNLVIQVLDKIGPTMAVLRQDINQNVEIGPTMAVLRRDINQNVERIEKQCESDPSLYSNMVEIVKKEVEEKTERKGNSCSKALVWLTRTLDFTVALLERLARESDKEMEQIVDDSYNISLKSYHRWISSAACKVCLKLIPDRKTFIDVLKPKDEDYDKLTAHMETLVQLLLPLLQEIHSILILYKLNKLKST